MKFPLRSPFTRALPLWLLAALALSLAAARAQTTPSAGRIVYYQNTFENPNGGTSYRIFLINPDGTNQTRISRAPTESDLFPDLSPDGTRIACNGSTGDGITLLNADGSNRALIPNTVGFLVPVWSPDGKRLLARYQGNTNSIAVFNPDGTGIINVALRTDFPVLSDVNWSPDGTRIVFTARAVFGNRQYHLFVTSADGSATPVKLSTDDDANYSTPSWSPDGQRILVSKSGGSGFGVYFVDAVTGAETKFNDDSDGNEQAATWSPDGTRIALSSFSGTDGGSLVVVNADGSNRRVLPGGQANAPRWRGAAAGGTGGTGGGGTTSGLAVTVPGRSNIWLAGAAPGTTASTGQDNLANATPFRVTGVTLTAGARLSFSATGNVSNDPANPVSVGPDGGPYLGNTFYGHGKENGITDIVAPINSLVGVFLNDSTPDEADTALDGVDYSSVGTDLPLFAPALRQTFFIGNGKTSGGAVQQIVVPQGATRLFLGALDPSDQENNLGSFAVTILGAGNGTGNGGGTLAVTDATVKSTSDGTGATAVPGDALTYTLTVRNTGTAPATGISITAILNGATFKSASTNGTQLSPTVNGSQLVFPKFNLPAGASLPVTVKAKVPATFPTDGRIVGLAASSITADAPTAPLTGLAGLNSTVLSPYQTSVAYNSNVGPGDVLTFRFTTTNRSTLPISGVASVIQVPAGVNFLSANADSGAALNVAPDGGGNLRIVLPDLAANSTVSYAVSVRIPYDAAANATITLPGTRLVVGGTTYGEPGVTLTLNGNPAASPPKLAISKSIVDPFSLAGLFLFDPARAAKLSAAFPQIAFYTPDPATGQPVPNGPAIQALGAALNPFIGLDDAGSPTGGQIRSVTAPSGKQPVTYVTFTLLYENTGGSNASEFSVTDRVPEGFAYVPDAPASALPGDLLPAPYALINGVPATPATLQVTDNGRTLNFRVKAKLKPGASGLIVYQLQVVPTAQGGPNPGAVIPTTGARISSSSLSGDVLASPDGEPLLVTGPLHFSFRNFTPGNNTGSVGKPAIFQFYYKNDGGKKTTAFAIKVPLPANTTFASASVLSGPGANGVTRTADGGALFTIGNVKPGQSGLVQLSVLPTAAAVQRGQTIAVNFLPAYDGVSFATPASAGPRPVARAAGTHPEPHTLGVDPQVAPVLFRPILDPTAPRLFIQRSAPLVVENGKDFTYVVVIGNLGDRDVNKAQITEVLPTGLDLGPETVSGDVVGKVQRDVGFDGRTFLTITTRGVPAHAVRSVTIHVTPVSPALFNTSGPVIVTDDTLYVTGDTSQGYQTYCPPVSTRLLKSVETLALVGSDVISGGLLSYGFDASAVRTVNRAVTTNSRITTIGGADVLTTNSGALIVPLGTNAGQPVGKGLGPVLATGPAGVVSNDGGSLISQDGGGLVASGAGNLIRVSGLISQDGGGLVGGSTQTVGGILAGLISQDGGGLVASGAGNLIRGGGLNLISQDGGGVISNDGGSIVSHDAGGIVSHDAGGILATGYSSLIGQDGGSIVSHDAGGLVASGAGNILANGGGKLVATGGGNIISDNSAGLIGSSPNTAAIVATGGGNLIGVSGGSIVGNNSSR